MRRAPARVSTLNIQKPPQTTTAVTAPVRRASLALRRVHDTRCARRCSQCARGVDVRFRLPVADSAPTPVVRRKRDVKVDRLRPPRFDVQRPRYGSNALVPARHDVVAGRNSIEHETSTRIRPREERVWEHEDDRTHVRVDVTKDLDGADPIEDNGLRGAARVSPEVEAFGAREGE